MNKGVDLMSEDGFKKDVDIATRFILKVSDMRENKGYNFNGLLLRELEKSDLTDKQKEIVRNAMN